MVPNSFPFFASQKADKVEHQHNVAQQQDENRPKNTVTMATWNNIEGSDKVSPNVQLIMTS